MKTYNLIEAAAETAAIFGSIGSVHFWFHRQRDETPAISGSIGRDEGIIRKLN
jgi:hypothetical protein